MRNNGFSLIELLTVMVLVGIMAGLGTVSFRGWIRKHELESQVKEVYTDLMDARITAMHRNRVHFVALAANSLRAYEDTNPAPNGDRILTLGADGPLCMWERRSGEPADSTCSGNGSLSYKNLKYSMTWNGSSTLGFNTRGLTNTPCTICVNYTTNPSIPTNAQYDCISLSSTRMHLGKLVNKAGGCTSGNCAETR